MDNKIAQHLVTLDRHAFFFDFDGTLADLQPRPELVFIAGTLHAALAQLVGRAPVAVISGRPLVQLDELLQPLQLPSAGVHGSERRTAAGEYQQLQLDEELLAHIEHELRLACEPYPELLLESKGVAFALHYRQAPALESVALQLATDFVSLYPETLSLQPGKCVFELKPKGASKGEVIRAFMAEAPFAGRIPVFLGDDLTDEAGFEVVNALGGLSIKVGEGATIASARLPSVDAVDAWLHALLEVRPVSELGTLQPGGEA